MDKVPANEDLFYKLESLPLLDLKLAFARVNNDRALLSSHLLAMVEQEIPEAKQAIQNAHTNGDWIKIEQLADQIKVDPEYFCTVKLHYACLYLERCIKSGHEPLYEKLYQQLLEAIDETEAGVRMWISGD